MGVTHRFLPRIQCASLLRVLMAILAVGLLTPPTSALAQGGRVVRGTVLGTGNGAPLSGATVRAAGGGGPAATSNERGRFTLAVPAGPVQLIVTRLGFAPDTLAVAADQVEVVFNLHEAPLELDPLAVNAEQSFSAASSSTIRELDLALRPVESAQALLPLVPGLFIAQHAGGGKAEQIFLRGFDADHGTDVAITVDGVPVNVVSHAHGQGYADVHFLMPEAVEQLDVRKGPYAAQDGDLATAGAVDYRTKDRVLGVAEARAGSYGTARVMALVPFGGDATKAGGYVGGAWRTTEGPFLAPQDFGSGNGILRFTAPLSAGTRLTLSATGYGGSWSASGQIPSRAVASGELDRFGAVDATEGGTTHRYDMSAAVGGDARDGSQWSARAYVTNYYLNLFSNFTYFLTDSVNGDGIEQRDSRWVYGVMGSYGRPTRHGTVSGNLTVGAGLRIDDAQVGLFTQVRRDRLGTTTASLIDQQNWFLWARQNLALGSRVNLQIGLRGDLFDATVRPDPGEPPGDAPPVSGSRTLGRVSPKLNLSYAAARYTTLYANAGLGFHSNDARDMVQAAAGEDVLPAALGTELGVRQSWRGGSVALAAWSLHLQSELVYVGDEGVTEAVGPSQRVGLDFEGRQQVNGWLWLDLDLNWTRGWLTDEPADANEIPLAPRFTAVAGLTVRDLGPVNGGVRVRHINDRPAIEDASVTALGYTVTQLFGTVDVGRGQFFASVDNLFNIEWNEAQFATTSRLATEPNGGITDLNFTPGSPFTIVAGVRYIF
jgi:outer membrane receptor protein involved in Fe transport